MLWLAPISPALPPLVGCAVALISLWLGWSTLRARRISPLLAPVVRLNLWLAQAVQGGAAAGRQKQELESPAAAARAYGYAWMYAGALGLIIAGGQLARVIASGLG